MKFSKLHRRVWRSLLHCTPILGGLLAGGAFAPITPAGADNYSYSGVDRHCAGEINRSVMIGLSEAANLEVTLPFTLTDQAGIAGLPIYCQLQPKAIATSKGVMWGTPGVVPIAGTTDALVITVDEFAQVLKVERWNVVPKTQQDAIVHGAMNWDNPPVRDRPVSRWLYEQLNLGISTQPVLPSQPAGNAPMNQPIPEQRACP